MQKTERAMQWHFALLTILCGALLGNDSQTSGLAGIALIAAISSMILVDRLKWIWLPPPIAYLLMLFASMHSMYRFFNGGDGRQIGSVAILLVLVQAILLFQKKSRRVYEQLTVFCLLQLIVSAVLNDALSYGLLLAPIALLLLSALCHLQAWRPLERTRSHQALTVREVPREDDARAWRGIRRSAVLGWLGVICFTMVSFYLLPRSKAMQPRGAGSGIIGFSDRVTLDQIGHLASNPAIAMRVSLANANKRRAYQVDDQFYLRGAVLDSYHRVDRGSAEWKVSNGGRFRMLQDVPSESLNSTRSSTGFDSVNVHVELVAQARSSLFSVAPYHKNIESEYLSHLAGKWLLTEAGNDDLDVSSLTHYGFGTNAFYRGRQTPWLRQFANPQLAPGDEPELTSGELNIMRRFNEQEMPTVAEIAQQVVEKIPKSDRKAYNIVQSMERYLKNNERFSYTNTLDMPLEKGVDPIEKFVSEHQKGNCQHFASALAMMLRSQGYPSRLIVGYLAHEYNSLGEFYVVRQQDAHAWVEVYLNFQEIPGSITIPGQLNKEGAGAWLRLDPTPGNFREGAGQVSQAMDLAQSLWKSYVVEMNDQRQTESIFSIFGDSTVANFSIWERLQMSVTRIRAGELGEGQISIEKLVSWQAAIATILLGLGGVVLWQLFDWVMIRLRRWLNRRDHPVTTIPYFASLVKMLSAGGKRRTSQTPLDWSTEASTNLIQRGFPLPTGAIHFIIRRYYGALYGGQRTLSDEDHVRISKSLEEVRCALDQPVKS